MGFLAAIPAMFTAATAAISDTAAVAVGLGATSASAAAASAGAAALGEAALVTTAVGGAVGAYSTYQTNMFQSAIAKNNASIAQQNSTIAQEQGAVAQSETEMRTSRLVGAQLAAQGANGVDVNFGSPAAVRQSTQSLGDFDSQTVRYNALLRSLGFNQQANSDLVNAQESKTAATTGALGSLLGSAGSFLTQGSSLNAKFAAMQAGQAPSFI